MYSIGKVSHTKKQLSKPYETPHPNVKFYAFGVSGHGLDPREQLGINAGDAPWKYTKDVCHTNFGGPNGRYESLTDWICSYYNRNSVYGREFYVKRRREAARWA